MMQVSIKPLDSRTEQTCVVSYQGFPGETQRIA
jgi:hypothetical protein